MIRRKIKKFTGTLSRARKTKELPCRECREEYVEVTADIGSVVCADCVQKMIVAPPAPKVPVGEGFPRGWHLKLHFVAPDGRIFVRGQEWDGKGPKPDSTSLPKKEKAKKEKKAKEIKPVTTGFPRGWHFKARFVAPDGRVFSRGKELRGDEINKPIVLKEKPVSSGRPRGWHFKAKYVSPEGKVYCRGVEVKSPKKK